MMQSCINDKEDTIKTLLELLSLSIHLFKVLYLQNRDNWHQIQKNLKRNLIYKNPNYYKKMHITSNK